MERPKFDDYKKDKGSAIYTSNELLKYTKDLEKYTYQLEQQLALFIVSGCTCKIPEPIIKNSENGISAYCKKCTKQYSR